MGEPVPGRKPVLALLMRLLWAAALVLPAFGAQAAVVLIGRRTTLTFPLRVRRLFTGRSLRIGSGGIRGATSTRAQSCLFEAEMACLWPV
jgi:hypothetical protein